jgi:hypothetical protein
MTVLFALLLSCIDGFLAIMIGNVVHDALLKHYDHFHQASAEYVLPPRQIGVCRLYNQMQVIFGDGPLPTCAPA